MKNLHSQVCLLDKEQRGRYMFGMYTREYQLPAAPLSDSAVAWLQQYDFPGNVRELQNLMERAVLLANGRPVEPCHFLLENDDWPLFEEDAPTVCAQQEDDGTSPAAPAAAAQTTEAPRPLDSAAAPAAQVVDSRMQGPVIPLHEMERIMILKGLEVTSGNRTQAADLLGISVRTLRNKLNEYRAAGHPID